MKITIEVIEHQKQRYNTCGDWQVDLEKKEFKILVSNLGDWHYNFLVAFHELVEAVLCFDRGITTEEVDKFDKEFEAKRDIGDTDEPGDNPEAPYWDEHFFATSLERLMCREMELDWQDYEEAINNLEY